MHVLGKYLLLACSVVLPLSANASTSTTTGLAVTAAGSPASSVPYGTAVTLTATVTASGSAPRGRVNFCNADAPACTGANLLGFGEVTPAGTASLVVRPMPAARRYRAQFVGNANFGSSSSGIVPLAVTGQLPTSTAFTATGTTGNYTLNATVRAQTPIAPTGAVSFQDTSAGNSQVAHAALGTAARSLSFSSTGTPGNYGFTTITQAIDFNNDGYQDLIYEDIAYNVGVLLSDGHGGLTPGPSIYEIDPNIGMTLYPRGNSGSAVVADFNGDGKLDLAVFGANYDEDPVYGTPVVLVQLAGSPSLITIPVPVAGGLLAGDYNGDGLQDLMVVAGDYNSGTVSYKLLAGHGDGTFTASTTGVLGTPTGTGGSVAAADVNGDGIADLLFASSTSVNVFVNQGNGTFVAHPTTITAGSPYGALMPLTGDFNGDGKLDLVATQAQNTVFLAGNGDGTFQAERTVPAIPSYASQAIDVDGDGNLDAIAGGTVYLGAGDGTFAAGVDIPPPDDQFHYPLYFADLDSDGRADDILQDPSPTGAPVAIYRFLNTSTMTATATATGVVIPGAGARPIAAHYEGDTVNAASTSSTILLNAGGTGAHPTASLVTLSSSSIAYGAAVNVTVTVRNTTGSGVPTGKVSLYDASANNMLIGYTALTGGQASVAYKPLSVGQHHIIAGFAPADATLFAASADNFGKTVTMQPMATTMRFSVPQHTFGDAAFFLAATSNSPVQITYSVLSGPARVYGQRLLLLGAGTVVVRASQAAQGNYGAGAIDAAFSVARGQQTLTFLPPPATVTLGSKSIALQVSASTGAYVYPQVQSGPGTILYVGVQPYLAVYAAGVVVVTAQLPEDNNYYASRKITYSIKVNSAP